jgi:predicted metal-binding protein
MTTQWIVGWGKLQEPEEIWGLKVEEIECPPDATPQPNTLFQENDEWSYVPFDILSRSQAELLSALENLLRVTDGSILFHQTLEAITKAAYEAGKQSITPPDNA